MKNATDMIRKEKKDKLAKIAKSVEARAKAVAQGREKSTPTASVKKVKGII